MTLYDSMVESYAPKSALERQAVQQEWYVRNGFACNLKYLSARGRESNSNVDLSSREAVIAAFKERIATIDFKAASDDVRPFLKDTSCLDIWSRDYFSALVDMIKFK